MTQTNRANSQNKASTAKIEKAESYIYSYINYFDVAEVNVLINYLRTGNGKDDLPPRISQRLPNLESLLQDGTSYFMLGSSIAKEALANRLENNLKSLVNNSDYQYQVVLFEFNTTSRFMNNDGIKISYTLFYHLKLYYENSYELNDELKYFFDDNKEKVDKMYLKGKKIFEDLDNKDNDIFISSINNNSIRWTIEDPQCQAISDNIFEL